MILAQNNPVATVFMKGVENSSSRVSSAPPEKSQLDSGEHFHKTKTFFFFPFHFYLEMKE